MTPSLRITHHDRTLILIGLTMLAFLLRWVWQDSAPPGWRDDELINSLVISQKVLDGDLAVYYADASGHEALYHVLNALFLGLFGPGAAGIRLLSAILGALTVPMTYLVGRKLFGNLVGGAASLGLAFSFWSLMYSRIGLRHILMPLLTLGAFYFFWRGLLEIRDWRLGTGKHRSASNLQSPISNYLLSALFVSLGFYTYFAGRGLPLILLAFMGYLFLFDRERAKRHWRGWAMMLGVTAVLTIPLLVTLRQQPESEARVAELAVPLVEAQEGDFAPLWHHIRVTLSMFHSAGDDEWLYNIPNRPVFGPIGAIFFWSGVAIALWHTLKPLFSRFTHHASYPHSHAAAFLLLWWLAGISPGFISVPPASLGHTIMAQPAAYLLAALPIWQLSVWVRINADERGLMRSITAVGLMLVFVAAVAIRDLPDYFVKWPQRGMTRFLYHADAGDVARYLNENPITDVGISSLLDGPWTKLAFGIELADGSPVRARWFNPERAILLEPPLSFTGYPDVNAPFADWYEPAAYPNGGAVHAGGYTLSRVRRLVDVQERVCFENGLCWVTAVYHPDTQILELGWQVGRELDLPDIPLISNPPPPGVYAGPRLAVFGQLWDTDGSFVTGDDGLWVDPTGLQPGDLFIQQHWFNAPEDAAVETAVFGLYDPMTGQRILTEDGREYLQIPIEFTSP